MMADPAENAAPQQAPQASQQQMPLAEAPPVSIEDRLSAVLQAEEAPPPAAPPQEAAEPEPQAQEPPQETVSADEAPADEAPDEAPAAEAEQKAESDDEVLELETYDDLAEMLGVEIRDLYSIPVPMGGGENPVSIGQLKDQYQASAKLARERNELQAQREAAEQAAQQQQALAAQQMAQAAALVETAERQLISELEGIDWAGLERSDAGQWAAQRQKLLERQHQIRDAKASVETAYREAQERAQAEFMAEAQRRLEQERVALFEAVPEWRDEAVAESERSELRSYLAGQGFSDAEIGNAVDHRLIVMALKARKYDQTVEKADVAKKRIVKIGKKALRPGRRADKAEATQERDAGLRRRLRETGHVDDAAALLKSRLDL